jgi:hypothetical protein
MPPEMLDAIVELAVNPRAIGEHMQKRTQFYLERNISLPEFYDDAVYGLALSLKGQSPEEVYKKVREEIFRGVMLHEIGHTLGMTHNFRASADALNYFDEFWDIEERFETDAERDLELQPQYRYTSIMDYGARFNSDFEGLGKYDQAAIKFAYTGMVEKFEDDVPVPGRLDMHLEFDNYTKIPDLLGGDLENLKRREDIAADEAVAALRQGVRENGVLFAENPTRAAKDYWIDRTVPYFYCFDYYNGNDPRCRTWDEGPTYEESVRSAVQRFWNYYFFNNYRRGRDEYQYQNAYFGRIERLMPYLEFPFQSYAFLQQFTNRDGQQLDVAEDLLRASALTTDFMLQVLGTPDPGPDGGWRSAVASASRGDAWAQDKPLRGDLAARRAERQACRQVRGAGLGAQQQAVAIDAQLDRHWPVHEDAKQIGWFELQVSRPAAARIPRPGERNRGFNEMTF